MPPESSNFAASGKVEKFPVGPTTSPRPGPTLAIALPAADNAVSESSPIPDSKTAMVAKVAKYTKKKLNTETKTSSVSG